MLNASSKNHICEYVHHFATVKFVGQVILEIYFALAQRLAPFSVAEDQV